MGYHISKFGIEFCNKKGITATNNLEDVPDEAFDARFLCPRA